MKKVLFVATVESHLKSFHEPYLKLLKEHDYKTFSASRRNLSTDKKLSYCDVNYDICVERSPLKFNNIKAIYDLKKIINNEKFNLIHCHTPMGSVVTRLAARKARQRYGTKVIYTAHGFHFYKGAPIKNWLLFYPVEWYLSKFTDTLITINLEDYLFAKKHFNNRCKKIKYVPGVGIDIKKFEVNLLEKEKTMLKRSFGFKKGDYILTCIARLDKNKNQGFLIDCMRKLTKIDQTIKLLLVGPDEFNGEYQLKTKKYDLNNNIYFAGKRSDIPQILKITDIVVSASKREGLPVNIMEALASNVPVVALNCRGMNDLIINGQNGFIVTNMEEYVNKVIEIKNNNILKKTKLDRKFIITSVEKEMEKIYKL